MCHKSSSGYLNTFRSPPAYCAAEMTSLGTLAHPGFRVHLWAGSMRGLSLDEDSDAFEKYVGEAQDETLSLWSRVVVIPVRALVGVCFHGRKEATKFSGERRQ